MSDFIPERPLEAILARRRSGGLDEETDRRAAAIVHSVRDRGQAALVEAIERFENREANPLVLDRETLEKQATSVAPEVRSLLERTAERIRTFARSQLGATRDVQVAIPGGRAGHRITAVERAGCYAPAGRHPLPSSILMTVIPARVAGVRDITVAGPGTSPIMACAAEIAGTDRMLLAGGAHAIGALAYGVGGVVEPVDVIVGPGSRWVTAGKKAVSAEVGLDMLAGPSELLILADDTTDPSLIADDLIAQAEHDEDARVYLVTTSPELPERVRDCLTAALEDLPTAAVAASALRASASLVVASEDEAATVADALAAEHVEILTASPSRLGGRLRHGGALFVGAGAAEVLGDYGAGPNHTLPTGGQARFASGLSVETFLKRTTWLEMDDPGPSTSELVRDAVALARLEGLEGHARSAARRLGTVS